MQDRYDNQGNKIYSAGPASAFEDTFKTCLLTALTTLEAGGKLHPASNASIATYPSGRDVDQIIIALQFADGTPLVSKTYKAKPQGFALELAMRQDFERRCMDHFNAKRAAGVKIIDDNGSPATPEALFWKNPDGTYGVQAFNVAWIAYRWGFQAARGMEV